LRRRDENLLGEEEKKEDTHNNMPGNFLSLFSKELIEMKKGQVKIYDNNSFAPESRSQD